eukprot:2246631-Amphidinium_carterae.1
MNPPNVQALQLVHNSYTAHGHDSPNSECSQKATRIDYALQFCFSLKSSLSARVALMKAPVAASSSSRSRTMQATAMLSPVPIQECNN